MEADGPGEIENIVQHRFVSCEEPVFRVYVDGADSPSFTFRGSLLGVDFPFLKPLADSYIGPYSKGFGPIRVMRSFVPITFNSHCKVTTDIRLFGKSRVKGEGGWGHVIYRTFNSPQEGLSSDVESQNELRLLRRRGLEISGEAATTILGRTVLNPGRSSCLASFDSPAVLSAVRMSLDAGDNLQEVLQGLWISITFDSHSVPDVLCPVGCFAGNYLGQNDAEYLTMGTSCAGDIYNTFPMPFWENCTISIENRSDKPLGIIGGSLKILENDYDRSLCGYFRNTPFYPPTYTPGADSHIGEIRGCGRMVAATVSAWAVNPGISACEGDVHVRIDGRRRPVIQSDGSESYSCYGWGFATPPPDPSFRRI